jgi:hypothetical protein
MGERELDGTRVRIASFHLDYLIDVAQDQVSTLPKARLPMPDSWVARRDLTATYTALSIGNRGNFAFQAALVRTDRITEKIEPTGIFNFAAI